MPEINDEMRTTFREQGFVVVPDVLGANQLTKARAVAAELLAKEPPPENHVGFHFLWPRFESTMHPLLSLYREAGIAELASALLRPDLGIEDPDFAQLAVTIPPWPHRPGSPHVDGVTPTLPDGTPGTFTVLAGIWLTDHEQLDRGNLYVWPGTHLRLGEYLQEHGADALTRVDEMNPGPYPKIDLGEQIQVSGPAGSVLFAHYLLGHNIGGHFGNDHRRETVYYRLHATGHRERWREVVTNPLLEFRQ